MNILIMKFMKEWLVFMVLLMNSRLIILNQFWKKINFIHFYILENQLH